MYLPEIIFADEPNRISYQLQAKLILEYVLSSTPVDRRLLLHQEGNTPRKGEGKVGDYRARSRLRVKIRGWGYCGAVSSLTRHGWIYVCTYKHWFAYLLFWFVVETTLDVNLHELRTLFCHLLWEQIECVRNCLIFWCRIVLNGWRIRCTLKVSCFLGRIFF